MQAAPPPEGYLASLWRRRELATLLATSRIRARSTNTYLGLAWAVANPLFLGAIYLFVFTVLFRASRGEQDYILYLLSGIFVFYYSRGVSLGGPAILLGNARLITNVNFPRLLLPIASVIEAFLEFLAYLAVYGMLLFGYGVVTGDWRIGPNLLWLLPAMLIHTVFNLGVATLSARVAVPFRDVTRILPYFNRLWLYMSPILWQVDRLDGLPAMIRRVLELNPMAPILAVYRSALMDRSLDPSDLLLAGVWALVLAVIGTIVFVRFEKRMARYL